MRYEIPEGGLQVTNHPEGKAVVLPGGKIVTAVDYVGNGTSDPDVSKLPIRLRDTDGGNGEYHMTHANFPNLIPRI